jgi:hypothetical protein
LNDSIKTTEFLEENWNAELSAAVFNFKTRLYDELPLQENYTGQEGLAVTRAVRRLQYDKSDGMFCGMISPAHISASGGMRLRITAHNLENRNCTGFAWFDYAYLAPAGIRGKININTADTRVLSALKNITPELADNIVRGIDTAGKPRLKPYRSESSLLDVAGITPDIYRDICNLITVRSDQFRVVAVAQTLTDINRDGIFDRKSGDSVTSKSCKEVVIDRGELTDGNSDTQRIRILQ